jgi:uncharacterized protein YgiM (DUF1202 family)
MIVKCIQDATNRVNRTVNKNERYAVLEEREDFYLIELGNFSCGWFPKNCFKIE